MARKCNLALFERKRGERKWNQIGPAISGYDERRGVSRAAIVYQNQLMAAAFDSEIERRLRPVKLQPTTVWGFPLDETRQKEG